MSKPLIMRRNIDGHEMVCVAPWYWDEINNVISYQIDTIEKVKQLRR